MVIEEPTRTFHGWQDLALHDLADEAAELRAERDDLQADVYALRAALRACLEGFHRSQARLARYQRVVLDLRKADDRGAAAA